MAADPTIIALAELVSTLERARAQLAKFWGHNAIDLATLLFLECHDDVTPLAIGQWCGFTSGSVTAMLDRLESGGLVERLDNPADRRSLLIASTPRGTATAKQVTTALYAAMSVAGNVSDAAVQRWRSRVGGIVEALAAQAVTAAHPSLASQQSHGSVRAIR
jgi:DNA-binding MarR family transcriptional regulator